MGPAMSSGGGIRRRGIVRRTFSLKRGIAEARAAHVRIHQPGATALTGSRKGQLHGQGLGQGVEGAFAGRVMGVQGSPRMPAVEVTLMIEPRPCSFIGRTTAFVA